MSLEILRYVGAQVEGRGTEIQNDLAEGNKHQSD
jgi:hypothetical protein